MIREYFKNIQDECWKIIEKDYPETKSKYELMYEQVDKSIKYLEKSVDKITILDAGCGHNTMTKYNTTASITFIGIDLSVDNIKNNKDITLGFVSDLTKTPLEDKSVNIIVSAMVFEHLDNPEIVFNEFNRILKCGGFLIFATPCIYNIVTIVNRMVPHYISQKLANLLTGTKDEDTYPTRYKINSIRRIKKVCDATGFSQEDLIMYQPPPYAFVFSKLVCKVMIFYYKVINKYDFTKSLRGVIIARYRKVSV